MFYLALILIVYLLINGLMMILAPADWYQMVPGVSQTGEFNGHFITDIGFAFILSACGITWRLLDAVRGKSAALIGAFFLLLHAGYHLFETMVSNHHAGNFFTEFAGIYIPAFVGFYIASSANISSPSWFQRIGQIFAHIGIKKFAQTFYYDANYMHDIADADLDAIVRFSLLQELGDYRKQIPTGGWYAAKLAGCISEDCGPCTQLVVRMAESDDVDASILSALVEGKRNLLDDDTRLFYDYAQAVVAHDLSAETYREEISKRFGQPAVISAGLAIITGKAYPLMKYATGHGQACGKVQINGEDKLVNKAMLVTSTS